MVRGNGSARAETSVKAATRPNTIRITMRRGPLRDQPRRYKGPVDGTAVLDTPTPATARPPAAARTTRMSRDSLPEPAPCPAGCPRPRTPPNRLRRRPHSAQAPSPPGLGENELDPP